MFNIFKKLLGFNRDESKKATFETAYVPKKAKLKFRKAGCNKLGRQITRFQKHWSFWTELRIASAK